MKKYLYIYLSVAVIFATASNVSAQEGASDLDDFMKSYKAEKKMKVRDEKSFKKNQRKSRIKAAKEANRLYLEALKLYKAKKYKESNETLNRLKTLLASGNLDKREVERINKRRGKLVRKIYAAEKKMIDEADDGRIRSDPIEVIRAKQKKSKKKKRAKKEVEPKEVEKVAEGEEIQEGEELPKIEKVRKVKKVKKVKKEKKVKRIKKVKKRKKPQRMKKAKVRERKEIERIEVKTAFDKREVDRQEKEWQRTERQKHQERAKIFSDQKSKLVQMRQDIKSDFKSGLDSLYSRAVRLYKRDSFLQARELFVEINELSPDYKSTSSYLAKIQGDLENKRARVKKLTDSTNRNHKKLKSRKQLIADTLDKYNR